MEHFTQLAIVDIDGVIANADARFEAAERATQQQARLQNLPRRHPEMVDFYWRQALSSETLYMDVPIAGAVEALNDLRRMGFEVLYLTSRPEHMRAATLTWLDLHAFEPRGPVRLVMKPSSAQYVKTVIWKCLMVEALARYYSAVDLIVIDDEQPTLAALAALNAAPGMLCFASLAETMRDPHSTSPVPDEYEHPF